MKPPVVCLLPRAPHPTRDGGAIRMHHLLRALTVEFRVRALVLRADSAAEPVEIPAGVEAREILHRRGALRRALAAARSVAGREAFPALLYESATLDRAVGEEVSREMPAWVVAFSYHLGPAALRSQAPSWIDFQNVDSQIWARIGRTASSPIVRGFSGRQARLVQALEGRLVREAAGFSCVSPRDAQALKAMSPRVEPLVVPNGADLARYRFRASPAPGRLLFFVGDLSWPPNAEGIRWFHRQVWPILRRSHPDIRVEILGRGAGRASGGESDFRFLGEGGDTRPHWERAAIAFVPLWAGGGTRLKILEAAACGVPVVSTPVGAEGLDLAPGVEIAIAEDAASFAEAVSRLLADPEARARQAAAARRKVEAVYDWASISAAFASELCRRSSAP